ncbi:hypothetical protein FE275_17160 [Pseudomonas koreensis]|nr:hypothetical protein FE275_17160 [Pseudomonas koreensis]
MASIRVALRRCGPITRPDRQNAKTVGASLLAKASDQSTSALTVTPHSRAGSLPQGIRSWRSNSADNPAPVLHRPAHCCPPQD